MPRRRMAVGVPWPIGEFGSFRPLRRLCVRVGVPLADVQRWDLPDRQVTAATHAARTGAHLPEGVDALAALVTAGGVKLAGPAGTAPSRSELVVLASVLRSSAANEAAT